MKLAIKHFQENNKIRLFFFLLILNTKYIVGMEKDLISVDDYLVANIDIKDSLLVIKEALEDEMLLLNESKKQEIASKLYILMNNEYLEETDAITCYKLAEKFECEFKDVKCKHEKKEMLFSIKLFNKNNIKKIASSIEDTYDKIYLYNAHEMWNEIVDCLHNECNDYFKNNTNLELINEYSKIDYLAYLYALLKSNNAIDYHKKIIKDILPVLLKYKIKNIDHLQYIDKICNEVLNNIKKEDNVEIYYILCQENLYHLIFDFYEQYIDLQDDKAKKYDICLRMIDYIWCLEQQKIDVSQYNKFYQKIILLERDRDKIHYYLDKIKTLDKEDAVIFFNHLIEIYNSDFYQLLEQSNSIISIYSHIFLENYIKDYLKIIIEKLQFLINQNQISIEPLFNILIENEEIAIKLFSEELFQSITYDLLNKIDDDEEWQTLKKLILNNNNSQESRLKKECIFLLVQKCLVNIGKIKTKKLLFMEKEPIIQKECNQANNYMEGFQTKNNILFFQKYRYSINKELLNLSLTVNDNKIKCLSSLIKSSQDRNEIEKYALELINLCIEDFKDNEEQDINYALDSLLTLDSNEKKEIIINREKIQERIDFYKRIIKKLSSNDFCLYCFSLYYLKYIKTADCFNLNQLKQDLNIFVSIADPKIKNNTIALIINTLITQYATKEILKSQVDIIIAIIQLSLIPDLFLNITLKELENILKIITIYIDKEELNNIKTELSENMLKFINENITCESINCTIIREYIKLLIAAERHDIFLKLFQMSNIVIMEKNKSIDELCYAFLLNEIRLRGKEISKNMKVKFMLEDINELKTYLLELNNDINFLKLCHTSLLKNKNVDKDNVEFIFNLFEKLKNLSIGFNKIEDIINYYNEYLSIVASMEDNLKIKYIFKLHNMFKQDCEKLPEIEEHKDYHQIKKNILKEIIQNDKTFLFEKNTEGKIMCLFHLGLISLDVAHQEKFKNLFFDAVKEINNGVLYLYYNNIIESLGMTKELSEQKECKLLYDELLQIIKNKLLSLSMKELIEIKNNKNIENTHFDLEEIREKKLAQVIKTEVVKFINDIDWDKKFSIEDLDNNEKEAMKAIDSEVGYSDDWDKNIYKLDLSSIAPDNNYPEKCTQALIKIASAINVFAEKEEKYEDINRIVFFKESSWFKEKASSINYLNYMNKIIYYKSFFDDLNKIYNQEENSFFYEKGIFSTTRIALNEKGIDCKWLKENALLLTNYKKRFTESARLLLAKDITLPKSKLSNILNSRLTGCNDFVKRVYSYCKNNSKNKIEDICSKVFEEIISKQNRMIENPSSGGVWRGLIQTASQLFEVPKKDIKKLLAIKEEEK